MKPLSFFVSTIAIIATLQAAACKTEVNAIQGGDDGAGAGGNDPGQGGGGSAPQNPVPSTPEIIVAGHAGVLAVDDTYLYIGDLEPVPFRVPKAGGTAVPVVSPDSFDPAANVTLLALDDTHIYWVGYISLGQFGVWRAPKDGSGPATLLSDTVGPNNAQPFDIAIDDEYVYLTLPDIFNSELLIGAIHRVPKTGGTTEVIANVYNRSLAADGTYVYWPQVTSNNSGELIRANKDGSNQTVVTKELGRIANVFGIPGRTFWTYEDAGSFYLRSAGADDVLTTLATTNDPYGFRTPVAAADAVYWFRPGDASTGAIFRADFNGNVTELVNAPTAQVSPAYFGAYGRRLAVDDQAVYWSFEPYNIEDGTPRVYRVAR